MVALLGMEACFSQWGNRKRGREKHTAPIQVDGLKLWAIPAYSLWVRIYSYAHT